MNMIRWGHKLTLQKKIIDKGGHYFLAVKENHVGLLAEMHWPLDVTLSRKTTAVLAGTMRPESVFDQEDRVAGGEGY